MIECTTHTTFESSYNDDVLSLHNKNENRHSKKSDNICEVFQS